MSNVRLAQLQTVNNRVNKAPVKPLILSAVIALLSACSPSVTIRREALMDRIESALVLPVKARPLREYARYYAQRADGMIEVFLTAYTHQDQRHAENGCIEMLLNDASNEGPCEPSDEPSPGERHWIDIERMPQANDGGCSIINAVYDPSAHRIMKLWCNGPE